MHAAAAKMGLHIPKACVISIVGTCTQVKTDVDNKMQHDGETTDDDVDVQYVLAGCRV
uniref:hypothetical protein n=1 Tax=Pseudomonas aeruginosa TaxID=287 RepID=UPI0035BC21A1